VLRIAIVIAVMLVLVIMIVVAAGYALPIEHVAERSAVVAYPPARVFGLLTDVEGYPRWRGDVTRVDVLSRAPHMQWREHGGTRSITFEAVEVVPPVRLVSRIADPALPFGGTWTYRLAPEGPGTRVTITEQGQVFNPVFRFMSRFVFGHTATIDAFLADLRKAAPDSRFEAE